MGHPPVRITHLSCIASGWMARMSSIRKPEGAAGVKIHSQEYSLRKTSVSCVRQGSRWPKSPPLTPTITSPHTQLFQGSITSTLRKKKPVLNSLSLLWGAGRLILVAVWRTCYCTQSLKCHWWIIKAANSQLLFFCKGQWWGVVLRLGGPGGLDWKWQVEDDKSWLLFVLRFACHVTFAV